MDPSSLYLGRVVGVGATREGKPFVVYAISGRSESSKERKLVIDGEDIVRVASLGEPTPQQLEKSDIFFYPAIKTGFSEFVGQYGIVSNGIQTDTIDSKLKESGMVAASVKNALKEHGHEGLVGDKYNTPRIAGVCVSKETLDTLGIINEFADIASYFHREKGKVKWLPTYLGEFNEDKNNYDVTVPTSLDTRELESEMLGKDAQELTKEFYEWMNQKLVVSTGAAVFDTKKYGWDLAVENLHDR